MNALLHFGYLFLVVLSSYLSWEIVSAIKGKSPSQNTISLDFPLRNGSYYVLHGGNDETINGHYSVLGQKFALDIVKLNSFGVRSNKFLPKELQDYCIYSEALFSPASGTVLRAIDAIEDSPGLNIERENPAGNHLVIQVENTNRAVILAHLLRGSLQVKEGEKVGRGQFLAKVGNSGNTSEPHLHMHVVEINGRGDFLFDAEPVSMIFDGKFLVRNSIYSSN